MYNMCIYDCSISIHFVLYRYIYSRFSLDIDIDFILKINIVIGKYEYNDQITKPSYL